MRAKKISYDEAIEYFDCINNYLVEKGKKVSVEEVIQLLNNNEPFRERFFLVFDQYKERILSGEFNLFDNNEFLNDTIATYFMISFYNTKNDVDDYETEISKLSPEMKEFYDYANSIRELTWSENIEVTNDMLSGYEPAKKRLLEVNYKHVFPIAYTYLPYVNGYTFEDLIQEGNYYLIKCLDTFTFSKGYDFSKYAKKCISNNLYRNFISNRNYVAKTDEQLSRYKINYIRSEGRKPTLEEINGFDYSTHSDPLDDVIEDVFKEEVVDTFNEVQLEDKVREIIELRCGLNGKEPLTLEEVGDKYNISRERVRQIENKGLRKTGSTLKRKGCKDFFVKYKDSKNAGRITRWNADKKKEENKQDNPMSIVEKAMCHKEIKDLLNSNRKALDIMTLEEASVFILKSYEINDKKYSYDMIAQALDMSEKDVKDAYFMATTKCIGTKYTDNPRKLFKRKELKKRR